MVLILYVAKVAPAKVFVTDPSVKAIITVVACRSNSS